MKHKEREVIAEFDITGKRKELLDIWNNTYDIDLRDYEIYVVKTLERISNFLLLLIFLYITVKTFIINYELNLTQYLVIALILLVLHLSIRVLSCEMMNRIKLNFDDYLILYFSNPDSFHRGARIVSKFKKKNKHKKWYN